MPIVGTRPSTAIAGRGYQMDPMKEYAVSFNKLTSDILHEQGYDLFQEANKVVIDEASNDAMKNFFVENSADYKGMTAEEIEDHVEMMTEQYNNDREAILEYAPISSFNPVIGLSFPIHKNILMNNIFDKGAIPKVVATSPKFTVTMETRTLVAPDGTEIDMFKEQYKMFDAIESAAPLKELVLSVPELGETNVLSTLFSANELDDNLSIETYISGVVVNGVYVAKDTEYTGLSADGKTTEKKVAAADGAVNGYVFEVNAKFVPAYGEFDRQLMSDVNITYPTSATATSTIKGWLSGWMKKNRFGIQSSNATIAKVVLKARIDTSTAMLRTAQVKWSAETKIIEIPNAIPLNTPISPEEVKDIAALYQVNQLTKVMSLFKVALGNYKDDKIRKALDESFIRLPSTNKIARTFDFAPREGYMLDHIEWRNKTFMDALDTYVTQLLHVLNDPNMTITVIGRDDLIRKITPTEYTYQTPSNIGPVELDFVKTVTTSDKRTYQFISSDKLRNNNNLMVILCPRNTERFMYRIYDYQMYVSNEIRNANNPALPAIHAFERWTFEEYQPVQGRVKILNPTGLREMVPNTDPIGPRYGYNDFDIDNPEPTDGD